MSLEEVIVSAMLMLQPPGVSLYSTVAVDPESPPAVRDSQKSAYRLLEPGEPEPPFCATNEPAGCSKPKLTELVSNLRVVGKEYRRAETKEEGLERYRGLARAWASADYSKHPVPHAWMYLVTIGYHESGFRRDVQEGIGPEAIGDCKSQVVSGVMIRIPGSCRSHGPFQTLFSDPETTDHFGIKATELVGLDEEAAKKSAKVALRHLARVGVMCRRDDPERYQHCVLARYGSGLIKLDDPRIVSRVKTLRRVEDLVRQKKKEKVSAGA